MSPRTAPSRVRQFESADAAAPSARPTSLALLEQLVDHDPLEQIETLREGVDPSVVDELVHALRLTKEQVLGGLGVAVPTVNRKLRAHVPLSSGDSEQVFGLVKLLSRVRGWTPSDEAKAGEFDAGEWLGMWLSTPNPALGGKPPLSLLDTGHGQQLVESLLASMESGSYW